MLLAGKNTCIALRLGERAWGAPYWGPTAGQSELFGEHLGEPRVDAGGGVAVAAIRHRGGQPQRGPSSGPRQAYRSGAATWESGQKPKGSYGGLRGPGASLASRCLAVRSPKLWPVPLPEQRARRALP